MTGLGAISGARSGMRSGARSGALLAVASAVSIAANYVFLLATGRVLGSDAYGAFAALVGLLAVVLIPATALQMAVSREVSRRLAAGEAAATAAFARATLRLAAFATVPLLALSFALAAPIDRLLHIHSLTIVLLAETTLATALLFPVAQGVLQGANRFGAVAVLYVVPVLLRLLVFALAAAAGFRLGGAVFATVFAAVAGVGLALGLARDLVAGPSAPRPSLSPFLSYLGPVVLGLVGIALLTHVDILIVKARFPADTAGAYGAASAFARVGFFLPATILAVLFPRTAARQARGEETEDILGRSLLATAAFCGALAIFYAAAGVGLVSTTFGVDFAEGGRVLAPYALAIGFFSLANILVGYHLSRGETRYAWIVAAGVVIQIVVLATVPSSLDGVVWANVCIGAGLLVVHEVAVGSSWPALRAGLKHLRGPWARTRGVLPETAMVLLGATVFVCVLFWPLVRHLGSTIVGFYGGDATGSVAWFWQARHESGFHLLGATHHSLTGAPFGWSETNALQLQVLLPYYPTYLLAHVFGDVVAWNLTLLAGYILTGATMYALVRYLGCSRLVATWAALVSIVFPWHLARAEHVSLLHVEVLVVLVFALVAASRRPSWLRFALVGAANFACWLTSGYFGAIAMVTTVAFGLGAALVSGRRRGLTLMAGTAAWSFAGILLLGVAAAASGTNAGGGLKRQPLDLWYFGVRLWQFVVPPAQNIVVGDSLRSFWSHTAKVANPTETTVYLGWLTLVLAAGWIVFALRRPRLPAEQRSATAGLAFAFVISALFAFPSPSHIFGASVTMPAHWLWRAVPAFHVPSRWDPLIVVVLVPLAAFGLDAVLQRIRVRAVAIALVGAALAFSFLELAINPADARFRTSPAPAEYSAVERTPPGVLAEYPLGHSDIFHFWQTKHGRPILNNAPPGSDADYARLMLLDPSQPGTAAALSLLGVTAIALHPGLHVDTEVDPREPSDGFRLVGRFADHSSVWEVVAPPAPAFVTLPGGFATPRRAPDTSVGYPLISSAGVGVVDLLAKAPGVVRLVFSAYDPNGKARSVRLDDGHGERSFTVSGKTTVSVLVEVPRGRSQLLLKTDPAPTSEEDTVVISAPRAEPANGAPQLHPARISGDPGF